METTTKTFSEAVDTMQQAFKTIADIYTKGTLSVLDAYNKQLSISAEWYNNLFNSTFKTDFKKNYEAATDLLKKNLDAYQQTVRETTKLSKDVTEKIFRAWSEEDSFSPVSKEVTDAIFNIFSKQAELLSDSGRQFLNTIYKEENLKASSEQFKNVISNAIKTAEQSIKNLIEEYNRRAEFTQKASEQLLSSINKQFDAITEVNKKFFDDVLKAFEQKKAEKDGTPFERKTTNKK